jgi:hypothetical protein
VNVPEIFNKKQPLKSIKCFKVTPKMKPFRMMLAENKYELE